jgi:hypothetical protein
MEILTSSSRSIGTESSLTKVSSVPSTITTILRPSSAHYSKPKKLSCSIMLCPPIFKQMDNHRHANSKQAYRPCKSCQILAIYPYPTRNKKVLMQTHFDHGVVETRMDS